MWHLAAALLFGFASGCSSLADEEEVIPKPVEPKPAEPAKAKYKTKPAAAPSSFSKDGQAKAPAAEHCRLGVSGLWTLDPSKKVEIETESKVPECLAKEWLDASKLTALKEGTQYVFESEVAGHDSKRITAISYVGTSHYALGEVMLKDSQISYHQKTGMTKSIISGLRHASSETIRLSTVAVGMENGSLRGSHWNISLYPVEGMNGTIVYQEFYPPAVTTVSDAELRESFIGKLTDFLHDLRRNVERRQIKSQVIDLGTRGRLP